MAIDRTRELLEFFETAIHVKENKANNKDHLNESLIRNRHKKERFAVEDVKSPSLRAELKSDSDMEGVSTPPNTFTLEANNTVIFASPY